VGSDKGRRTADGELEILWGTGYAVRDEGDGGWTMDDGGT
jgi:hypothetical protein